MNIYVASPMQTYNTPLYRKMRQHIEKMYPGETYHFAEGMYKSSSHWLSTWPELSRQMDMIVFFTDTKNYIGKGVRKELDDMLAQGKPAYLLLPDGRTFQYPQECKDSNACEYDWRHYQIISVI